VAAMRVLDHPGPRRGGREIAHIDSRCHYRQGGALDAHAPLSRM
jgi:hypothetical protein